MPDADPHGFVNAASGSFVDRDTSTTEVCVRRAVLHAEAVPLVFGMHSN